MSNGGPHGDKWNKYPVVAGTSSDNVLTLLNTPVEGKYATASMEMECSDGKFLFVANYGVPA